jgi:hypothetical protein
VGIKKKIFGQRSSDDDRAYLKKGGGLMFIEGLATDLRV